jgi:hypothetical protein
MKCGVGEGWRRSVGPIVWEMKLQPQVQTGTAALFDNLSRQFAWHCWGLGKWVPVVVCERQLTYANNSLYFVAFADFVAGQSALRHPVVTESRRPCQNCFASLANDKRMKRGVLLQSLRTTVLEIGGRGVKVQRLKQSKLDLRKFGVFQWVTNQGSG